MIGNRIKQLRKRLKLNQKIFGEYLGVSDSAISQLEKGKNQPSRKLLKSICSEYRVNPVWLETGKGEMFNAEAPHAVVEKRPYATGDGRTALIQETHSKVEEIMISGDMIISEALCQYVDVLLAAMRAKERKTESGVSPEAMRSGDPIFKEIVDIYSMLDDEQRDRLLSLARERKQLTIINSSRRKKLAS
jgi:transcriptional regulator with XRE-family HTH domain